MGKPIVIDEDGGSFLMKRIFRHFLPLSVIIGIFAPFTAAQAALITWRIEGIVDSSELSSIQSGDAFTLLYQFTDGDFGPDQDSPACCSTFINYNVSSSIEIGSHGPWISETHRGRVRVYNDLYAPVPYDVLQIEGGRDYTSISVYNHSPEPGVRLRDFGVFPKDSTGSVFIDDSFPDPLPGISNFDERPFSLWFISSSPEVEYRVQGTLTGLSVVNIPPLEGPPPAVPIPPALWLFGSALSLLGWLRKKGDATL